VEKEKNDTRYLPKCSQESQKKNPNITAHTFQQ